MEKNTPNFLLPCHWRRKNVL